jgi:aminocarboxymuconate-semialdehyde decarboxylase
MSKNFVDIHAHFLPTAAVTRLARPDLIELEAQGDPGRLSLNVLGRRMDLPGSLSDVAGLFNDMERRGIVKRYLSNPPFLFLYELAEPDGIAWAIAYNDAIIDLARSHPGRLAPSATLPMGSPSAAVAEIDRVRRQGVGLVHMATNVLGRELGDDTFRQVFDAIHRTGTTVLLHPHYIEGRYGSNRYHLRNLVGNAFETTYAATHLAASGLLDAYPGIRICLSHGGGALPYLRGRLQHGRDVRDDVPLMDVDTMLRSFYYDSAVFSPEAVEFLVSTVGPDRVYYGTDFPFDMSDPLGPEARFGHLEAAIRARLPRDLSRCRSEPTATLDATGSNSATTCLKEER